MAAAVAVVPMSYAADTASSLVRKSLRAYGVALAAIGGRSRKYDPSGVQETIYLVVGTTLAFSPEIIQFIRNSRQRED